MKFPKIDKYILFEVIGRGGMGEIFLGKNPGFDGIGKFLAIKKIRPEFTLDPEMVRLFRREAQVAIKLNHSNIGSIYEFGMHDQSFFLVMEFIAGTSLDNIFQRFKAGTLHLGPQEAIHIILARASALSYAHRFVDPETQEPSPVIHRDVSPHNILVSYEGEVKLIDFGIARMEGGAHHTQTGAVMGKVVYMSPEQLRGERVDHRTDIYALGIILWELLTGSRYYGGQDNNEIRQRLQESKGPKPLPGNIPFKNELDEFLQHMMAPDPKSRYATAEELAADLQFFYNQNFPGHSQMNLRTVLQEAYVDDIRELKRKLARYSALGSKQNHSNDDLDETAVVTSTVTAITPTMTIQVPASLAKNEDDLRKLVEDVVSSQVTSITTNRDQPKWKKIAKVRYLWILGLLVFTLNIAFNQGYRSQFLENVALLEDLYQRIYKNREDIRVVTGSDGQVVALKVGSRVVAGKENSEPPKETIPLINKVAPITMEMNQGGNTPSAETPDQAPPTQRAQPSQPTVPEPRQPASKSKTVSENTKPKENGSEYKLFIDSEPRGADIYINGKKYEWPTPVYVKFKSNKTVKLELRKKGYQRHMELTSPSIGVVRPRLTNSP